jgi:predicted glycoside hydrolase/deacetylase ChbG (UPF0249 family)
MNVKNVIFNADDFGASTGINRGIIEAHTRGVVTSTSMMITGRAAAEAAALAREHPELGVGLHWDVWGEQEREFDLTDETAVREEFDRQLDEFVRLMDGLPTHVDSHKHAHRDEAVRSVFRELVAPLGVPLREDGQVRYVGGFYAQWEWKVTQLEYVSVEFLQKLLATEVTVGWTEMGCHPGFHTPGFSSSYDREREAEVRTLTDPRLRAAIEQLDIKLVSYTDYSRAVGSGALSGAHDLHFRDIG